MKVYELCLSPLARIFPLVVLTIVTVSFSVVILSAKGPPPFLIVPFLAIMGFQWWVILTLAYRVIVFDDGSIEWIALARRVRTLPEEIREISPDNGRGMGFFRVVHARGKVRFLNQITGFHEVIVHIKGRHPGVVLKGC